MDLEERKDLLYGPTDDPLGLSEPDGFDALQWASLLERLHLGFIIYFYLRIFKNITSSFPFLF